MDILLKPSTLLCLPDMLRGSIRELSERRGKALAGVITRLDLQKMEVAVVGKISRQTLDNWIAGIPPRDESRFVESIMRIAKEFNFPEGEVLNPGEEPNARFVRGPAAEAVKVGFSTMVALRSYVGVLAGTEGDEAYFQEEVLPREFPVAFLIGGIGNVDKHSVLFVNGRSLEPRIKSGSMVLVFDDSILRPNTIVAAADPDDRTWIKVLREGAAGKFELHSISPSGANFTDLTGWRIGGHVIFISERFG